MKKLTTLVLLAFFVLTGMSAQTTAKEQAQTLAERFFKQGQRVQSGAKGVRSANATSLECRWDSRDVLSASSAAPTFYAFEPEVGQGFVIVAGDGDNARVIGYSYENSLPEVANMPDGLADFLGGVDAQVMAVRGGAPSVSVKSATPVGNVVVNLNTAPWGQRAPFNNLCFTSDKKSAATGCVPTAYSILMHYHQWPNAAIEKVVQHTGTGEKITLGHEYDWENMSHSYSGTYTTAQADAVATLMRDVGYAYGVVYGTGSTESGGGGEGAGTLIDVFKYKSETPSNTSGNHTRATIRDILGNDVLWKQYIKQSLDAGLPIPYSSIVKNPSTGISRGRHIFILDGYTDADYYHFNWGWSGTGNGWYTLDNMTTDDTSDYSTDHRAYFMLKPNRSTFTITVATDCGTCGTVSATYRGDSGTSFEVDEGLKVTLTATPADGYLFEKWTCGTEDVSTSATYEVTANASADYVAHFKEIATIFYSVGVSSAEESFGLVKIDGGIAAASANKTVNHGTEVTLTAVPKSGYVFKNWTRGGEIVSIDNPLTVEVTEDLNYVAAFVPRAENTSVSIIATTDGGGTATVNSKSSLDAERNEEVTLAATPASGYYFVEWRVGEEVVSTKATFTTSAQTSRTYKAVFAQLPAEDVTIKSNYSGGGNGYIGESGTTKSVTVAPGTSVKLRAQNASSVFLCWTIGKNYKNGGVVISNKANLEIIALSSVTYFANFAATIPVSATTSANTGGTASVTGDQTFAGEVTFKATANTGYNFTNWTNAGGQVVSTEPYYTTLLTTGLALTANFEVSGSTGPSTPDVPTPETYNISVSVNGTNGTATASSNSVTAGQQVTLTATPMAGYRFVNWTKGTDVVSTDNPYIFVPTESGEYVANFEAIPVYNISVLVYDTNGTATTSSSSVTEGESVTLTATPMAGYRFVNWTKGTDVVSTENPYIFVPTASGEYVANFEEVTLPEVPGDIDKQRLRTLIDQTQALVDTCYDVKDGNKVFKYDGSLYITEAQVEAAAADIVAAEGVYNLATLTQTELDTEVARMQGVYDALAYAVNHALLPVRLTTDLANPYIYKIGIARTATSHLELDDATQKVAVAPYYELGNKAQGWYFLDGTDGKVLIAQYTKSGGNINVDVNTSNGTLSKNYAASTYYNRWESNQYPGLYFQTGGNNMKPDGTNLSIAPSNSGCTWTLGAPTGYKIGGYGFKFRTNGHSNKVTLTIEGNTYTATNELQPVDVDIVDSNTTSFTQGGANNLVTLEDFYITLVPTTSVLASNSLAVGTEKVDVVDKDSDGYVQEWTIVPNAKSAGWYNIYCENANSDKFYFSHNGGGANKMGFYNDVNDAGTKFQFGALEASSFDYSDAYNRLYNFVNNEVKVKGSIVGNNTAVGYYSETMAEAYNTAYDNAWDILNGAANDAACTTAYENMEAANSALKINTPDINKRYIVRSAILDSYCTDGYVYANSADHKLYWQTGMATAPQAVWYLWEIDKATNKYMMQSIHTGTCTNGFTTGTASPLNGNTGAMAGGEYVTIKSLSGDGIVGLVSKNGTMMHAQEEDNSIVSNETDKDGASAWRIEEVDLSTLKYELTIGTYGYAGLHLNFPVEIPDGLQAYIVTSATGDNGIAILEEIQNIIPANTAVIVKSEEARNRGEKIVYYLPYSANAGGTYNNNWLKGANFYQTFVAAANMEYYIFGVKGGEVGLYKSLRYTATGQVDKENGTYIKCSGNKIYLPYSSAANAAKFSFRFDGGTTTDLEEALFGNDAKEEIFDLQGRRVERITAPGLYIVNGQKRYVKAAKF